MSKKIQVFVAVLVVCLAFSMMFGCSKDEKASDPTSPLAASRALQAVTAESQAALPSGFYNILDVTESSTELSGALIEEDGRAVAASTEQGYLCFGKYYSGYPGGLLRAVFSVMIDNNTDDNQEILVLDVYDRLSKTVLEERRIRRREFSTVNAYTLFEVDFMSPAAAHELEFRIYYLGSAYVRANKIAVVSPSRVSLADVAAEFGTVTSTEASVAPTPVATAAPTATPTPTTSGSSSSNSDYCNGDEIICLSEMTSKGVAQEGGSATGGSFMDGQFYSSSNGAIIFPISVNIGRPINIEFEVQGDIANWRSKEFSGGKVSLLTLEGSGNYYYAALQRMPYEYRGGGIFRIILGDRKNILDQGGAFLITHASFAGAYSMEDWGIEPHEFKVLLYGNDCQMDIDSYSSSTASAPYSMSGQRNINLVLGNREPGALSRGEGAITQFAKFKVYYQ